MGAVARLPEVSCLIPENPGTYRGDDIWDRYAQPGALAVDSVTWSSCQEWLKRLNRWLSDQWYEMYGLAKPPQLALPSESQWEVACRAGSSNPFHFGDTLDAQWANYDASSIYGLGRVGQCRKRPVSVGTFGLFNSWGLAEMHGQLYEWCADQWHRDPLAGSNEKGEALDGLDLELNGNQEQIHRVRRGGSWVHGPRMCRSAMRFSYLPDSPTTAVGLRPVYLH